MLRVPNDVVSLSNTADSFKPYNVADALGDTTPTVPPPPAPKGCGVIGMIIMIVVMVVVTIFTAGAMLAAVAPAISGFGGIMAAGAGALTGGFAVAGVGTLSLTFAGGAIAAAAGSVASQLVGMAIGAQDKFDWKGVATAAIGGGITAGLSAAGAANAVKEGTQAASMLSRFGSAVGKFGAVGNAVAGSALSQGLAVATGLQSKFSWKDLAIAAISAPVKDFAGSVAGSASSKVLGNAGGAYFGDFIGNVAAGYVSKAIGGKIKAEQVWTDAFGNALGSALTGKTAVPDYGGGSVLNRISSSLDNFGTRNFGVLHAVAQARATPELTKNPGTGDGSNRATRLTRPPTTACAS